MKNVLHHYGEGLRVILVRLINARYSLPTWLWTIASVLVGFIVFSYALANSQDAKQFTDALPFGGVLWGGLLTLAGLLSMLGMALNKTRLLKWSAMTNFVLWLFGAIAFQQNGGWANVVIFPLPMLLFWAYKYLATYVREFPRL